MTMTVNISGTFSEKHRPDNGLERVAEFMDENRISQVPVVAIVEWHANGESKNGKKMSVAIKAIEPGVEADGSDPHNTGRMLRDILDELRKRQGLGSIEDTLFSSARGGFDFDGDGDGDGDGSEGGSAGEEMDGQEPLIRTGPDGEFEVPPPSQEELDAEAAESEAAAVPAATFSGGDQ